MKCLSVCFDLLVPVSVSLCYTCTACQLYLAAILRCYSSLLQCCSSPLCHPGHHNAAYLCLSSHTSHHCLPHQNVSQIFYYTSSSQSNISAHIYETELGTRDCRLFSYVLLILYFILISMYAYSLDSLFYAYTAMVLLITAMLTIVADPFKTHLSHLRLLWHFYSLYYCLVCMGFRVKYG